MKITKSRIRQLINESIEKIIKEETDFSHGFTKVDYAPEGIYHFADSTGMGYVTVFSGPNNSYNPENIPVSDYAIQHTKKYQPNPMSGSFALHGPFKVGDELDLLGTVEHIFFK